MVAPLIAAFLRSQMRVQMTKHMTRLARFDVTRDEARKIAQGTYHRGFANETWTEIRQVAARGRAVGKAIQADDDGKAYEGSTIPTIKMRGGTSFHSIEGELEFVNPKTNATERVYINVNHQSGTRPTSTQVRQILKEQVDKLNTSPRFTVDFKVADIEGLSVVKYDNVE